MSNAPINKQKRLEISKAIKYLFSYTNTFKHTYMQDRLFFIYIDKLHEESR